MYKLPSQTISSCIYIRKSSTVGAFLGLSLGLHSIILTQQKLESGWNDSGCVHKIKMIPEIVLNEICVNAELEFNLFSYTT